MALILAYFRCTVFSRKTRRISLPVFFFLCLWLSGNSQDILHWHLVRTLNVGNGLPQNTIRSMYFDKNSGFLWLATEGGLVRYDGVDIKTFNIQNLPSLTTPRIHGIYQTVDHRVLAVERTGAAIEITGNSVVVNHDLNMFWINGLDRLVRNLNYVDAEKKFLSWRIAKPVARDFLSMIWVNDSLCLVNLSNQVTLYKDSVPIRQWKKAQPGSTTVFIVQEGIVYLLNSAGKSYAFDPKSKKLTEIRSSREFFAPGARLFQFDSQIPLLLNNGKISRLVFRNGEMQVDPMGVIPDCPDIIISLYFNPATDQLYCGTMNSGLFIYKRTPFDTYRCDSSSIHHPQANIAVLNNIYSSILLNDSMALTSSTLLFNLNSRTSRFLNLGIYELTMATDGKKVYALDQAGIGGTLVTFDTRTFQKHTFKPLITNARALYRDPNNGDLWISGHNFLYKLRGDSLITILDSTAFKYPIVDGFLYFFETPNHQIMGANGYAVCTIDTLHHSYRTLCSVDNFVIRMPYVDKDNLCWIPTYGNGIMLYDLNNNKLYKPVFTNIKGITYSHCFIDDGQGNFIIPTNNGLVRVNRESLIRTCKDPKAPFIYQYFDITNALNVNEFNGGASPSFTRMANGDILLPSLNGLVRLSPKDLTESSAYPLFVEKIKGKDSLYDYKPNISFASNDRFLTFYVNFGQWDYSFISGIFYRLDNAREWTYVPPGERMVQIANIDGGEHTLEIKKQFDLAGKKVSAIKVDFEIGKKIYERKAFWPITILCLVGLIWLAAYLRNCQLRNENVALEKRIAEKTAEVVAKNEELETALLRLNHTNEQLERKGHFQRRLIALFGHDIMIPLQYISKVSTQLINYGRQLSKETTDDSILEINTTSRGLTYLGQNIIQWIKLQEETFELKTSRFDLNQIVNELLVLHRHLAGEKSNQIEKDIPDPFLCYHDPMVVRVLIHNLLLNANKFTSQGTVRIEASHERGTIRLVISDTGVGMPAEVVDNLNNLRPVNSKIGTNEEVGWGLGYRLIIELLKMSQGNIHITSVRQHGTTVEIVLPPLHTLTKVLALPDPGDNQPESDE